MIIARYKWPVIIAASLHGALFLAFPVDASFVHNRPTKAPPIEFPKMPPDDTRIMEVEENSGGEASGPVSALPTQTDIPRPADLRDTFTMVPVEHTVPERIASDLNGPLSTGIGTLGDGPFRAGVPVLTVKELDRTPRAMAQPSPEYPYALRNNGVSGSVTVEFLVGTDGHVSNAEAVRWTHREFAEPAVRAVSRWRFEPGTAHGKKVRFRMAIPIEFNTNR